MSGSCADIVLCWLGLSWKSGAVTRVGPTLCWDFQYVDLAILEASLKLRGISTRVYAFWGLCCTKGLGLFLAVAEAWKDLIVFGGWCGAWLYGGG